MSPATLGRSVGSDARWDSLGNALALIAAADPDHARHENGVGFSSADACLGHRLVALGTRAWSPAMARVAWELCRRYRAQLGLAGIDAECLPVPGATSGDGRHEARVAAKALADCVAVSLCDGEAVVALSRYHPSLVDELKAIPGRRFDGVANHIPASSFVALRGLSERFGFVLPPEMANAGPTPNPTPPQPVQTPSRPPDGLDVDGSVFSLRFAYDAEVVACLKGALPQARWDRSARCWRLPASPSLLSALSAFVQASGLRVSAAARDALAALESEAQGDSCPSTPTAGAMSVAGHPARQPVRRSALPGGRAATRVSMEVSQ